MEANAVQPAGIPRVGQIAVSFQRNRHLPAGRAVGTGPERAVMLVSMLLFCAVQQKFCVHEIAIEDEDVLL